MTHIHVSVRTLWGSMLAAFVGAVGAFGVVISPLIRGDGASANELLVLASVVLTALPLIAAYLGYQWMRQIHYNGAYLVAAHEDRAGGGWLTRNRYADDPILVSAGGSLRRSFLSSASLIFGLGALPEVFGLFRVIKDSSACVSLPFVIALALQASILLGFVYSIARFRGLAKERLALTNAWRRELAKSQTDEPGPSSPVPQTSAG